LAKEDNIVLGQGLDVEQLQKLAREGSAEDILEYLQQTGLWDQVDVIREVLRSDPALSGKFERLEQLFIKNRLVREFHVHSSFSDGLFSPAELIEFAAEKGIAQMSVTDHDTIEGIEEARDAAERVGMDFVPGVELSAKWQDKTVHILGYGFDVGRAHKDREFMEQLEKVRQSDYRWAMEICKKSQQEPIIVTTEDGVEHKIFVTEDEIRAFKGDMPSYVQFGVVIARKLASISEELSMPERNAEYIFFRKLEPHLATESCDPGLVERYRPLFEKFKINVPAKGCWRVERFQSAENAVNSILKIGGLPVLSHPGEQELTEQDIKEMARMGIRGVEIYSYKHSPDALKYYAAIARKHGLFITSGTDFHDPWSRGKVGRNRQGEVLVKGVSIEDFRDMGAVVYENSKSLTNENNQGQVPNQSQAGRSVEFAAFPRTLRPRSGEKLKLDPSPILNSSGE